MLPIILILTRYLQALRKRTQCTRPLVGKPWNERMAAVVRTKYTAPAEPVRLERPSQIEDPQEFEEEMEDDTYASASPHRRRY